MGDFLAVHRNLHAVCLEFRHVPDRILDCADPTGYSKCLRILFHAWLLYRLLLFQPDQQAIDLQDFSHHLPSDNDSYFHIQLDNG